MINQIDKILPKSKWGEVVIEENAEDLEEVLPSDHLVTGLIGKQYKLSFFVRKTVAEKIKRVSNSLPDGLRLVLIEGFRSLESQKRSWDDEVQKIKIEHPDWSIEMIEQKAGLVIARPTELANHHCGGAVDVTLAYKDGTLVDMGTPYINQSTGTDLFNRFEMLSEGISSDQKNNRKILRDAMEKEDFVWYPGEWWHYCWGDRMWAVYSNQGRCFYGPAGRFYRNN